MSVFGGAKDPRGSLCEGDASCAGVTNCGTLPDGRMNVATLRVDG
jgi:hypothetical protein